MAGDKNLQRYVANNPVNYIDPSGFADEFPLSRAEIEERLGAGRLPVSSLYPDGAGDWTDRRDGTPFTHARAQRVFEFFKRAGLNAACSLTPGIGDYRDGYEFGSGKDMLTGEPIPWYWRLLTGISVAVPLVGMAAFRRVLSGADDVADIGHSAARVYDVGLANELRKNPLPHTEVHHVPQSRQAESLIGDFNPANKVGNEPAIRLPCSEHGATSASQRAASAPASARQLLADEIRRLRNNTGAPNSALQELIELNRKRHPSDFLPLHR